MMNRFLLGSVGSSWQLSDDSRPDQFGSIIPEKFFLGVDGHRSGAEQPQGVRRFDGAGVWTVGVPADILAVEFGTDILEGALVAPEGAVCLGVLRIGRLVK